MDTFQELLDNQKAVDALGSINFTTPTPVQKEVIPLISTGQDLIVCAQTGSGKTGAFGIPMVERILDAYKNEDKSQKPKKREQRKALILAPTRELAQQITAFLRDFTRDIRDINVATLVGGIDIRKQFNSLKRNPQIIVATPGRLTDHLKRGTVYIDTVDMLVLDEGDRMLDMGFAPQLDQILKYLPDERQTLLFSATFADKVQKLALKYLDNPKKIFVGKPSMPVAAIKQSIVQLKPKEKNDKIVDELNAREGSVIIFLKTKRKTDQITAYLHDYGFSVTLIHGGRTQGQRNKAIRDFKSGSKRILCATDVAARGIDVPQVQHVINFDLPMMEEDYVHRIGRTARNGEKGEALSFVSPDETRLWNSIARKYKLEGLRLEEFGRGGGGGSRGGFNKRRSHSRDGANGPREGRDRRRPSFKKSFKKSSNGPGGSSSEGRYSDSRSPEGRFSDTRSPEARSSERFKRRDSGENSGVGGTRKWTKKDSHGSPRSASGDSAGGSRRPTRSSDNDSAKRSAGGYNKGPGNKFGTPKKSFGGKKKPSSNRQSAGGSRDY